MKDREARKITMRELITVTGLILKAEPIGEYDRRVVLLTTERGKITAFARGARKQTSRLMAATTPFSFGEFRVYEGRTAYNMSEAFISNYFENLRMDYEAACFGMYFLEVMDYCTRENNDERELLKLLYQSLRALGVQSLSHELVRYIFEIKTIVLNGEFPGLPEGVEWLESTVYAISFIVSSPVEKLYTFRVTQPVETELMILAEGYRKHFLCGRFRSLEVLRQL